MWARWMPNRRTLELHALRRITGNEWQEDMHHVGPEALVAGLRGTVDAEQAHCGAEDVRPQQPLKLHNNVHQDTTNVVNASTRRH